MPLLVVSEDPYWSLKCLVKISVLQVASWSLGGCMVDPGVMDLKSITFPYVDNMILTNFLMNLEYKKALKMYITTLRNRPKLGSF